MENEFIVFVDGNELSTHPTLKEAERAARGAEGREVEIYKLVKRGVLSPAYIEWAH